MMTAKDSARSILEALKEGHRFTCLSDLAKEAGFRYAGSRSFKSGLNFLIDKEVIKMIQSGWSSEKRGKKGNHPKGIILIGDIFTLEESFFEFEIDDMVHPPKASQSYDPNELLTVFDGISNDALEQLLNQKEWKDCAECTAKPVVFVTSKCYPLCYQHWKELSHRDIDWRS